MPSTRSLLPSLACLVVTLSACADKQNPVLPPSSGAPQSPAGVTTVTYDAGQIAPDALADLSEDANSDALVGVPCSMILQDCSDPSKACYPVSGNGMCLAVVVRGAAGATCADNRECDRGLVCSHLVELSAPGVCQVVCDLTLIAGSACSQYVCQEASGLPDGVGVCAS